MTPSEKKRLLLISHHNSYRITPYIKAALHLGIKVSIASEGKHSLVTEVANGIHIDFSDKEFTLAAIHKEHKKKAFSGVLGSDDQTVELAAHVAKQLHLAHNPPQAAKYSQRKDLARAQLALSGCPVPRHCMLDLTLPLLEQAMPYPLVLKPLNMSASRGVIRVDNDEDFVTACKRIKPIVAMAVATADETYVQQHILLEAYIDGSEIAYEGFLHDGVLNTITIFDKPDPLIGPYFAETIYVTPSRLQDKVQQTIQSVIQQACDAYGLTTGAIHAECRIDNKNNIWILEIASRTIGGDCSRMLDNNGFSIEELAISLAICEPVKVSLPEQARGVMMIPIKEKGLLKRVEGLLVANKVKHIDKIDIIIQPGHELLPLPEGNQYLGYIFASGDTAEQVTRAIRKAYSLLSFITAPVFIIS